MAAVTGTPSGSTAAFASREVLWKTTVSAPGALGGTSRTGMSWRSASLTFATRLMAGCCAASRGHGSWPGSVGYRLLLLIFE